MTNVLASYLQMLREAEGLSMDKIADAYGPSKGTQSAVERRGEKPSPETLTKYRRAFTELRITDSNVHYEGFLESLAAIAFTPHDGRHDQPPALSGKLAVGYRFGGAAVYADEVRGAELTAASLSWLVSPDDLVIADASVDDVAAWLRSSLGALAGAGWEVVRISSLGTWSESAETMWLDPLEGVRSFEDAFELAGFLGESAVLGRRYAYALIILAVVVTAEEFSRRGERVLPLRILLSDRNTEAWNAVDDTLHRLTALDGSLMPDVIPFEDLRRSLAVFLIERRASVEFRIGQDEHLIVRPPRYQSVAELPARTLLVLNTGLDHGVRQVITRGLAMSQRNQERAAYLLTMGPEFHLGPVGAGALSGMTVLTTDDPDWVLAQVHRSQSWEPVCAPGLISTRPHPWLEALQIADSNSSALRAMWMDNDLIPGLRVPLGPVLGGESGGRVAGEVLWLNLSGPGSGGSGPHGLLQGWTGAGKTMLERLLVLGLCTRYSPDRVNFVLVDVAGDGFADLSSLPHVLAVLGSVQHEPDMFGRLMQVLAGEVQRRQRLFRDAAAEDLEEYTRRRQSDPSLEPLPDLVVVIDECHEFLQRNPDHRAALDGLIVTFGRVGGHLLLASQNCHTPGLLRVTEAPSYAISLRAGAAESAAVIGTPAAAELPIGSGHAYIREINGPYGKTTTTKFKGFNFYDQYRSTAAMDSAEAVADGQDSGEVSSRAITVRDYVVGRLRDVTEVAAPHQLWLGPLLAPITLDELGVDWTDPAAGVLRVPIGVVDDPGNHRRFPYELVMEGAAAHVHVVGDRGTGRSTTLQTIVAGAAMRYQPDVVNFFLIDSGGKLQAVKDFPNVSGYGGCSDPDMVGRVFGEVHRVLTYRESHVGTGGVTDYLDPANTDRLETDKYGRIVLVIDDALEFIGATADTRDDRRVDALVEILTRGGSRGIHVVISSTGTTTYRVDNAIRAFVHHRVQDTSALPFAYPNHEMRTAARAIPSTASTADKQSVIQPGRVLELGHGLHARIALPVRGHIEPMEVADFGEFYDYTTDYTDRIAALGAEIAGRNVRRAPVVQPLPDALITDQFLELVHRHQRPAMPLGIDTLHLSPVYAPDASSAAGAFGPHMVLAGDPGSGTRNFLRYLLRYVVGTYPDGGARVWLIDPGMRLLDERDALAVAGMLGGYVGSPLTEHLEPVAEELLSILVERSPAGREMTAQQIRERSFYSGPEIVVVICGLHLISGGFAGGPLGRLMDELASRNDRGMQVFASTDAASFSVDMATRTTFKELYGTRPTTLLFSGTSNDVVFGSTARGTAIRFEPRTAGRAQVHVPGWENSPIIQTPREGEWSQGMPPISMGADDEDC